MGIFSPKWCSQLFWSSWPGRHLGKALWVITWPQKWGKNNPALHKMSSACKIRNLHKKKARKMLPASAFCNIHNLFNHDWTELTKLNWVWKWRFWPSHSVVYCETAVKSITRLPTGAKLLGIKTLHFHQFETYKSYLFYATALTSTLEKVTQFVVVAILIGLYILISIAQRAILTSQLDSWHFKSVASWSCGEIHVQMWMSWL